MTWASNGKSLLGIYSATGADAYSKNQKAHSKVSECSLKCAVKLAEWTGLEPATPGVTGRSQKAISMRFLAILDIPKLPIMAQHSCGAGFGNSKV